jgi:DNA-binding transcriptional MerR regulator
MANASRSGDNTAAIAAQFGISVKALRLYERLGMLVPARSAAGWRVYRRPDIERLHAILSLKQLGLPLARIGELLRAGKTDLTALLDMQETMLEEVRRETERALALVKITKVRIAENVTLTAGELAALVGSIAKTVIRSTPELEDLARRVYTPEQYAILHASDRTPDEMARMSGFWAQFQADLDATVAAGDPLSDDALALARRMVAFLRGMTRGDKALWNSTALFWQNAVADPRIAEQLPFQQTHWVFMAKSFEELQRRGDLEL